MKGSRKTRRLGCSRNRASRKQYGGAGVAYTIGGPVAGAPIINNYGQTIKAFPSCEEAVRPGYLEHAQIKGGLPGFSGGGKRRKGYKKLKGGRGGVLETGSAQLGSLGGAPLSGGAYTNDFANVGGVAIMEPTYSGCGAGAYAIQNPFDKTGTDNMYAVKSLITAPPALASNPTPMKGGKRRNRKTRKQYGGVGGVDSMFYNAPRAGYTNWPSNAEGGAGATLADGKTPFLLNVPYSGLPTESQACLKTGGGRKSRKGRKSKKSRKHRKSHKGRR
jgi:hypothetical protein